VLVTGGAGFIGANLCAVLARDEQVAGIVVLDDLSTGVRTNLDGLNIELVEGSILDPETIDGVMRGIDSVVHLAARP
jgi:UDP-glucose 4-epimerase